MERIFFKLLDTTKMPAQKRLQSLGHLADNRRGNRTGKRFAEVVIHEREHLHAEAEVALHRLECLLIALKRIVRNT